MHEPDGRDASRESAASRAVVAGLVYHGIKAHDQPVKAVVRFRRDVQILKRSNVEVDWFTPAKRGVVKEFSMESRLRLQHFARNCDRDFLSMLTITYPKEFPVNGLAVKKHLKSVKQWLLRNYRGIGGIWFLEFQVRGAPHFHLLLSVDLRKYGETVIKRRTRKNGHRADTWETVESEQRKVAEAWFRIVGSGDEKHLRAGACWEVVEEPEGCIRYAAAHAAKPHQKEVPTEYQNVGRFWGHFGEISLDCPDPEPMTTEEVYREFGHDAMSSKGRVKKYLWGANES